jgi:carboxyl-terminal processing protease
VKRLPKSLLWALVGPAFGLALVVAFFAGLWMAPKLELYLTRYTQPLPPLGEASIILEREFYGELAPADIRTRAAVRGLLSTLNDPYTVLLDPQPASQERLHLSGVEVGVGLELWWTASGQIAVSPLAEGPAEQAGVQKGDVLLNINGENVADTQTQSVLANIPSIEAQLQGTAGTTVTLALLHPPTLTYTVTLERQEVPAPSVEWHLLEGETEGTNVGYLNIRHFSQRTAKEVRESLKALQESGISALILDLRGNGGGVTAPLPSLVGSFLPEGTLIYRQLAAGEDREVRTSEERIFEGPLVLLVDGGTASAAEIVAAALVENERAIAVGRPTFGKGSIQTLYPLSDGSTLHVTAAVWLTPEGHRLDGHGLEPGLLVESDGEVGRDAILESALVYLTNTHPEDEE